MSDTQAKAVLLLWATREFDTFEIASLLRVPESAVARIIGAARALMAGRPETGILHHQEGLAHETN